MSVELLISPPYRELKEQPPSQENEKQLKSLYLINTRLWFHQLKQTYGQDLTIGTIPESEWNKFIDHFDYLWFMGIYQPSCASRDHALKYCHQYRYALPDLNIETDVVASPFAIPDYSPNPEIAKDWTEWDKVVEHLHQKNKKIIIDFVPNHTSLDHPWSKKHPDYYIQGTEAQYWSNPNFFYQTIDDQGQPKYLAHGKDPNFPSWSDTLQLNYANPQVQNEMENILFNLTKHCDGVRCDMAMLLNPDTFLCTWRWALTQKEIDYLKNNSFWQNLVPKIKEYTYKNGNNNFELIAEAYWDKEELGQSFDYIYNDDLYKHLKRVTNGESLLSLKSHLNYLFNKRNGKCKDLVYIENHDEDPATQTIGKMLSKPAALLTAIIPNSIFMVNQGQETGHQIKAPMQISRFPKENIDSDIARFYDDLLSLKKSTLFQYGSRKLVEYNQDLNLITIEISQKDQEIRAIICVNITQFPSLAEIDKKEEENIQLYNLSTGSYCSPENVTDNKIVTKLNSGDIKIIYLSKSIQQD